MDKKTENILMYAGIGVGALLVVNMLKGKSIIPGTTTPVTPTGGGTVLPPKPGTTQMITLPPNTGDNYLKIIYPAMLAYNPNVGNSSYTLTDAEAAQYLANYPDLQVGLAAHFNGDHIKAAKDHWHTNGVADKRTFMRLDPPSTYQYSGPPVPPAGSGGGGFWSSVLGIATTVVGMVVGVGEYQDVTLTDMEIELIANSAAIIKELLPMYYGSDLELTGKIDKKLTEVLNTYLIA